MDSLQTVSIIVPCYNVAKYLNKCMKSLISQTYTKLDIVLINDGSDDKTPALCDSWAKKDSRIRAFHKPNGGVSSARNVGILQAIGDYFLFVDPDDYIDKDMIEKMMEIAIKNDVDIVSCGYIYKVLFKRTTRLAPYSCNTKYDSGFILNCILKNLITGKTDVTMALNNPTKLIRSAIIKDNNIQYDESWNHAEDVKFMSEVYQKASSVYFMDFTPYNYIRHITAKSLTHHFMPRHFAQRVRYRLYIDELNEKLFGTSADDLVQVQSRSHAFIQYAHEEGGKILNHRSDNDTQKKYLQEIFLHKQYQWAVTHCNESELTDQQRSEAQFAKQLDFDAWKSALQNTHEK